MVAVQKKRDQPWLMRTYSGHSSAKASNALYRTNLAKGQTGLSVAFDLPTQTGYDADSPLAGARSARSVCRYRISRTWISCSTRSRSIR
jgi:methylmalonyl-CoA mutase N-terminal domain/subunit